MTVGMDRKYDLDYEKLILYEYNMKKFVQTVLLYCEKLQDFWKSYLEERISRQLLIAPSLLGVLMLLDLERSEMISLNVELLHAQIQSQYN